MIFFNLNSVLTNEEGEPKPLVPYKVFKKNDKVSYLETNIHIKMTVEGKNLPRIINTNSLDIVCVTGLAYELVPWRFKFHIMC